MPLITVQGQAAASESILIIAGFQGLFVGSNFTTPNLMQVTDIKVFA